MEKNNINVNDIYFKLGEIHSNVKSHETGIIDNQNKIKNHEERLITLETDKLMDNGIKEKISQFIAKTRIITLAVLTGSASLITIAYKLPSPTQEKIIKSENVSINNLKEELKDEKAYNKVIN